MRVPRAIVAILALAAAGCHGRGPQIAGHWTSVSGAVVDLKPDKTFAQVNGSATGTWSFANGKVTLHYETVGGAPVGPQIDALARQVSASGSKATPATLDAMKDRIKTIEFKLSPDGSTLTLADPLPGIGTTLKKVAER